MQKSRFGQAVAVAAVLALVAVICYLAQASEPAPRPASIEQGAEWWIGLEKVTGHEAHMRVLIRKEIESMRREGRLWIIDPNQ